MTEAATETDRHGLDRRTLLRGAALGGLALPLGALAAGQSRAQPAAGKLTKIKFATNSVAPCLSPVYLAKDKGLYEKYGLDVELIDFGGPTENLLEALATGKADAGVGMALRWLKALEAGFDVKITAGSHGGCSRLVALESTNLRTLADLKGKTIGITDLNSPGKHFFSILLHKEGLDPVRDVEWRQYPIAALPIAAEKGEVHAVADGDPNAYLWLKRGGWVQIASNLDHGFENRVCCIIGVRGSLVRDDPKIATALNRAVLEAHDWTVAKPEDAGHSFARFAPKHVTPEDIIGILKGQTHNHRPVGNELKRELALYAEELRAVRVFKASTDPKTFAEKVYADVFSA
ncbi:ABC transporter substrate-binding protein [Bosea sp. BH3]|uniref:ABC transporter substrate-binding protein n=1 Tax=Bosea sp. BH3 TaxID=2871701 RepID=UPI0021CB2A50|nr:ABC transporter substrate-binding protein [Bosea sp. BH3]MCU4178310.1 ABC transporter substrate-binding protein [Bosea sp. BH3]